ncbi:EamA family transporter, partial [Bacillus sp. D-CC]
MTTNVMSGRVLSFTYFIVDNKMNSFVIVGWGMIIGGIGVTIVQFITTNEFILLSTMKYVKLSTLPLITFVV